MLVQLHFVIYEDGTDLMLLNEHDHHVWSSLSNGGIRYSLNKLNPEKLEDVRKDPEELFYREASKGSSITQEEQVVFAGTFNSFELQNYVDTLKLIGLNETAHDFIRTHFNYVPTERQP